MPHHRGSLRSSEKLEYLVLRQVVETGNSRDDITARQVCGRRVSCEYLKTRRDEVTTGIHSAFGILATTTHLHGRDPENEEALGLARSATPSFSQPKAAAYSRSPTTVSC